ncbi:MAG: glucose-1-phosphate thymidylyltransferase [Saprospiraceae bacterium]|nr:glucose-1-phosphate thymidylyltransferase [Saprospiraceae bacterium]
MRNLILFDPAHNGQFKPLSWARPLATFRLGMLTIQEKWALYFHAQTSHFCRKELDSSFPANIADDNYVIQGHLLPNEDLCSVISKLSVGEILVCGEDWVAGHFNKQQCQNFLESTDLNQFQQQQVEKHLIRGISKLWELFQWNGMELERDFQFVTKGRVSEPVHESNRVMGQKLFIEKGSKVWASCLNTLEGPIYIGHNAEVMEGSMLRGPLAVGDGSIIKMGSKIYGPTTIGPECRIGGEVNNTIFQAYSNKAHDGFLGNSVIGEWVNIGADTNASNLKNNYEEVKLWNYESKRFEKTSSLFCGLIMGDHSKCGINTMFNTGTVVGYGANVFGSGFPRQFIPDFAWGGASGFSTFTLDKFFTTAATVMERRGIRLTENQKQLMDYVFRASSGFRNWENL